MNRKLLILQRTTKLIKDGYDFSTARVEAIRQLEAENKI